MRLLFFLALTLAACTGGSGTTARQASDDAGPLDAELPSDDGTPPIHDAAVPLKPPPTPGRFVGLGGLIASPTRRLNATVTTPAGDARSPKYRLQGGVVE